MVQNSTISYARLEVPKLYIHLYAFRERRGRQNMVLLVLSQDIASESVFTTDFKQIVMANFL